jgi:hypothetical protein
MAGQPAEPLGRLGHIKKQQLGAGAAVNGGHRPGVGSGYEPVQGQPPGERIGVRDEIRPQAA